MLVGVLSCLPSSETERKQKWLRLPKYHIPNSHLPLHTSALQSTHHTPRTTLPIPDQTLSAAKRPRP
ncbi:hypothetical protein IQ07DRAFT_587026 [Pyrenochaeta sp. DS3sAY3a]|nr:hypothetical protein IQ07DRAFT_587026 [Pyrenochaeta sp. DS3sAY3a]